jgi:glycosyltransferase involved in cell wall biosynthesis
MRRPMNIALDARWIFPEISGIGAYTRELIRGLARLDTVNRYTLLFTDPALRDRTWRETDLDRAPGRMAAVLLPYGPFAPRGQFLLPLWLARHDVDVFHSPNYMMPLLAFARPGSRPAARVTTLHDVIPLLFPDHAPKSRKARVFPLYRRLMVEVGRRSDRILTDSEASRRDILRCLRIPPADEGKVRAIHLGVGERPPAGAAPRAAAPRGPNEPRRLLYVGRMDPYKNVAGLIRMLDALRKMDRWPVSLVIAGSPDDRYPELRGLPARLGVADRVRWTGYLSDEQLLAAYREADVLVHASLYEGFGLQVLEAMALGLPVVASDRGSIPEVAGDAALLANPEDPAAFAEAVRRVLDDPALAAALSAKGLARAARFRWSDTAAATLRVYEELGARRTVP